MNAILGKIVSVKPGTKRRGLYQIAVRFKPTALLPARGEVPAWLVNEVLIILRVVPDPREIGGPGDVVVLTPAESEKWLEPLVIDPASIEGKLPTSLRLTLRWWKSTDPPRFTAKALGKTVTGLFSRRGEVFSASFPTKSLFDKNVSRPVEIEITCESLRTLCIVIPTDKPAHHRFIDKRGEGFRLLNPFYAIDIVASQAGGGIIAWRERLRGVDHFTQTGQTQKTFDKTGHSDRVWVGGQEKLCEAKLAFATREHETGGTRIEIEGVIDEEKNARSAVAYRLLDGLPLLVVRRDARLGEPTPDKKKEKPKEPTDSLVPLQLGFRHATSIEGDGAWGSALISMDGDRLAAVRACFENDHAQRGEWTLKAGWAMVHHPLRREVMLFLTDRERPPELLTWAGGGFLTLEPHWLPRAYRPPAGAAFTLAMSAGEIGGASADGAWVACRALWDGRQSLCMAIARLQSPTDDAKAEFRLGKERILAPLSLQYIEGIGAVHLAAAHFRGTNKSHDLDAVVAGIRSRSRP